MFPDKIIQFSASDISTVPDFSAVEKLEIKQRDLRESALIRLIQSKD